MGSELDPDADQAPPRTASLRPPPKPVRPRAILAIEAPLSPTPSATSAPTAASPLEAPRQEPAAQRAPRERFLKIASIIFAAGVLVGVGGSALVMMSRTPPAVEVAAPRVLDAAVPRTSAPPDPGPPPLATRAAADDGVAAKVPAVEPSAEPVAAAKAEQESRAVAEIDEPARAMSPLPVPSSAAPSCDHLTGFSRPKNPNKKTSDRETRVGNRQLMLGNVANAQVAYCKALAWDRSNIDRRVNLARLFLVRRDWKQAAHYGESALELNAKSRTALAVVGDAWAALGKTEQARKASLAAEGVSSATSRQVDLIVRRNMALAKRVERLKDLLLAERLYRRVLLLQPEHVGATRGIAGCLLKAGSYHAAEAWARRADALQRGKQER